MKKQKHAIFVKRIMKINILKVKNVAVIDHWH